MCHLSSIWNHCESLWYHFSFYCFCRILSTVSFSHILWVLTGLLFLGTWSVKIFEASVKVTFLWGGPVFVLLSTWVLSTWNHLKFSLMDFQTTQVELGPETCVKTILWLRLFGWDCFSPWGWRSQIPSCPFCVSRFASLPCTLNIAFLWDLSFTQGSHMGLPTMDRVYLFFLPLSMQHPLKVVSHQGSPSGKI